MATPCVKCAIITLQSEMYRSKYIAAAKAQAKAELELSRLKMDLKNVRGLVDDFILNQQPVGQSIN